MNKNGWKKIFNHLIPNVGTLVGVALMLFGYSVYAAPSTQTTISTFPYQGTLTDASGNPVTDNVDMTFKIYDVSTGGTALWTEAHTSANAVPVENGLFQLMLGSLVPIPESMWGNSTLYVEIQVGSETPMSPRELIGSVPRAIQADLATNVTDKSISPAKLNLPTGEICLSERKSISLPGSYGSIDIPELSLNFSLDESSQVLVWSTGLGRYSGTDRKETTFVLQVNSSAVVSSHTSTNEEWFNLNGQRLINLGAGQHTLGARVFSAASGTMVLHEVDHYKTCLYYVVLQSQ